MFVLSYLSQKLSTSLLWIREGAVKANPTVDRIISYILTKTFFSGYDPLTPKLAKERKEALVAQESAQLLSCHSDQGVEIDAVYIPSPAHHKTGNILIFAETTSYQDRLHHGLPPKYRHFLERGLEIVLWNPTRLTGRQYSHDLASVVRALRGLYPDQKIMIKAHCATGEPSIGAAAQFENVSLLLDRVYGDTWAFARSFSILTSLSRIRRIIQEQFSCEGMEKMHQVQGNIIVVAPEDPQADQIVFWKGKNATHEFYRQRKKTHNDDQFIPLGSESDHWSPWNADEYQKIDEALERIGMITKENIPHIPAPYPDRAPRKWVSKNVLPWLIKTYV